jgi:formylmethanofuran dehydrogenase subunit E
MSDNTTTTTTSVCDHCHAEVSVDELQVHDGYSVCPECLCECKGCGDTILKEDALFVDGEPYCEYCLGTCDSCGEYAPKDEMDKVRSSDFYNRWELVCPACADECYACDDCGDRIHGDLTEIGDGNYVCNGCLEHYWYCHQCDCYHHEDEDPHHVNTRSQFFRAQIGARTARFSLRTIGVEIETGAGADDPGFQYDYERLFKRWGYKEDGSLSSGGMELVSPPLGGAEISKQIPGVYSLLQEWDVDMEDRHAGCHVHVDYQDVREFLFQQDLAGNEDPVDHFVLWGTKMTNVVRRLVSSARAEHNQYCAADFGLRYAGESNITLDKKVENTGYAAIAVRAKTVEFRIWEVTGSADTTLARVELCQKSVDYLSRWLHAKNPKTRRMFERRFNRCVASFMRGNFAPLAKLFRLTDTCVKEFAEIYDKRIQDRYDDLEYAKTQEGGEACF